MATAREAAEETGLAARIGLSRATRLFEALQRAADESVLRTASREDLRAAVLMLGVGGRSAGNMPTAGPLTAKASVIVRAIMARAHDGVPDGATVLGQAKVARALVAASIAAGHLPDDFTGSAGPVRFVNGRPLPGAAALPPGQDRPGMLMMIEGHPETWAEFRARAESVLSSRLAAPRRSRVKRSGRRP